MALCMAYASGIYVLKIGAPVDLFIFFFLTLQVPFCWDLQNDLVHGWGLDFALRRCVEVLTISAYLSFFSLYYLNLFLDMHD